LDKLWFKSTLCNSPTEVTELFCPEIKLPPITLDSHFLHGNFRMIEKARTFAAKFSVMMSP